MTEIELDNIPYLIESKEMSVQEACIQVYRILYMNPARFNLQDLDADTRSDFLLYFLQYKAEKIVNTFNPEIALFGSYIFFTIQLAKITYIKAMTRKKNFEKTYIKDSIYNYYDMQEYAEKSVIRQKRQNKFRNLSINVCFQNKRTGSAQKIRRNAN